MEEKEAKLRAYISQVAIMELPLIKILTALIMYCGNEIPEDATIGGLINIYINKIPNLKEKAEDTSQENYDKIYKEFVSIISAEVDPVITEESKQVTQEITSLAPQL